MAEILSQMDWTEITAIVASILIPALLKALQVAAQKTPAKWDGPVVKSLRLLWSLVPVGERDPAKMGKPDKEQTL